MGMSRSRREGVKKEDEKAFFFFGIRLSHHHKLSRTYWHDAAAMVIRVFVM